ncbi:MAG TPA: caspase family protein [Burkholderiales bacterium]|nr:caspase family protein [Burkholderiales bacterium]
MKWLSALAILVCVRPAAADTRRLAVVVGNNAGLGEQPPLRYAETDAAKLAQVLRELGGFAPADVALLRGVAPAAVEAALAQVQQQAADWHRHSPANRVLLIFYFSGHSDGQSLELGHQALPFAELRARLAATGADVRVTIIDSCKSGALLAVKGGTPGPAFQIRLTEDLASSGEALLTSSAADEIALESREIGGSFFTHHLVSGLRGAADSSGDGRVTLSEAYHYAFTHTVSTTSGIVLGAQHPTYGYRLSGRGDLVLSELSTHEATLELPQGFDRVLVVQRGRDEALAELASAPGTRLVVPPGEYTIRAWRGGRVVAGQISVRAGELRAVRSGELVETAPVAVRGKGGSPAAPALVLTLGSSAAPTSAAGPLVSGRLGLRGRYLSLSADFATGDGDYVGRESLAFLDAGLRMGWGERLQAWIGVELGVGALIESGYWGYHWSEGLAVGPWIGAGIPLSQTLGVVLEGRLAVTWIDRDGTEPWHLLPALWLGLQYRL